MPTVLRIGGLRVVIYPNDHRPAHVHVIGESEATFDLNCPDGPPTLRDNYRFSHTDVARIQEDLAEKLDSLCDEWRRLHEHY
jgi:hypothetical protein